MADSTPVSGELSRATPEVQKYRPRACQSCARSKMRCVWPSEPGATPCQRCAKIKAPCTLPEINPRRRRGPSTRVGQLEEKIDGIMSLLNASQQIQQNSPSSSGQTPPPTTAPVQQLPLPEQLTGRNSIQQLLNPNVESNPTLEGPGGPPEGPISSPHANHFHTNARLVPPAGSHVVVPASSSVAAPGGGGGVVDHHSSPQQHMPPDRDLSSRPATADSVEIFRGFRVTFLEADRALNLYRSIYSPYFPFITIPTMITPYDLYEKAPFLFRTIVAMTTPQGPMMQNEFKVWFREYVAQHAVVNNEARLEILQAILVHLAWGEYYFMVKTEATNLIQLAMGLVTDLGLNRWPSDFGKAAFPMFKDGGAQKGPWRKKHSLEEMRAALGTFYVTSLCSTLFRRHHPMNHNSYLSKCCASLERVQEYDSDRFLVVLVRMQQILNRGADLIPYSDIDDDDNNTLPTRTHYTPVHMALSALHNEMEALVREQSALDAESQTLLWTHFHTNVCRLYEPTIYLRSPSYFSSSSAAAVAAAAYHDPSEATARTSALWQCLHAARDFFAAYLSVPPQNLISVPFPSAHLSFCLVALVRLLFLGDEGSNSSASGRGEGGGGNSGSRSECGSSDPDWNPLLARQSVDFETICLRVADLFDEADKIAASLTRRARYNLGMHPMDHHHPHHHHGHHHHQERSSSLGNGRDKIRWVRNWYAGRTRPGANAAGGYPPYGMPEGSTSRETRRDGGGGGGVDAQSQPMDVDEVSVEMDDTFWQAILDWSWNDGVSQ